MRIIPKAISVVVIALLTSMLSVPIYSSDNINEATGSVNVNVLNQRLNVVDVSRSASSEELGFSKHHIIFTLNSPLKFASESIAVEILLPDTWTLKPSVPEKDGDVTHFPFYAAVDIYLDEEYIGYIGICPIELPNDAEYTPTAIYNQIAIGNAVCWDTIKYYHPVKEDKQICNAVTKVMYSPRAFEDNRERNNTGILAYDTEIMKYVAIEIVDGVEDRTVLSDTDVSVIAKSILLSPSTVEAQTYSTTTIEEVENPSTGDGHSFRLLIYSITSMATLIAILYIKLKNRVNV